MAQVMSDLHRDHANLETLLVLLDAEARRLETALGRDFWVVRDIMDYMMNYPDLCHHPREDLVFKKLLERDPASRAAVEDLLQEHEALRERTMELAEAVSAAMLNPNLPVEQMIKLAKEYSMFLRRHIDKEESMIFPVANEALGPDDWKEIDAAITANDPLFGGKARAVYRALHERLAALPSDA